MTTGVPSILQSLRCDRAADDRRRHPRVGLRTRVELVALDRGGHAVHAWMRDLSEGGAGLLVPCELRPDQLVLLLLPVKPSQTLPVRCRVVHCQRVGPSWRAGVEFLSRPWHPTKGPVVIHPHERQDRIDGASGPPAPDCAAAPGLLPMFDCELETQRLRISSAVLG